MEIAKILGPMIVDTSDLINKALLTDKKILFEGAQGMMLCIDHGTYPFVTSSTPSSASVPVGAGISPKWIDNVVGVAKAYCTRVGEGPFPRSFSTKSHTKSAKEVMNTGRSPGVRVA